MLFDLRGRGRRRTVQVIYLGLAVLMGGGLVFFGIGGATQGGFLNAFNGNGSSSSSSFGAQVKKAQRQAALTPNDPAAWANLTKLRFQVASSGDNYDPNQGLFTAKGRAALAPVRASWDRYLALNPSSPNANLAEQLVQVLGPRGLGDYAATARALQIVSASRSVAGVYLQLSACSYLAGQSRTASLAAAKAASLAPVSQRSLYQQRLGAYKAEAKAGKQTAAAQDCAG